MKRRRRVDSPPQWVRGPRQDRSRRSLDRILDAAERLLETRSFSELTVADIVREARSSVGVFYSRFVDKDALLHTLDERFADELVISVERHFSDPAAWAGVPLARIVQDLIAVLIEAHRNKRGTLRAIVLQARLRPDECFRRTEDRMHSVLPAVDRTLLSKRREIGHPHPETAVRWAVYMAFNTLRDKILFESTGPADFMAMSDEAVIRELTRAVLGYLGAGDGRRSGVS
jgi:AcrR family transcriptional regulator